MFIVLMYLTDGIFFIENKQYCVQPCTCFSLFFRKNTKTKARKLRKKNGNENLFYIFFIHDNVVLCATIFNATQNKHYHKSQQTITCFIGCHYTTLRIMLINALKLCILKNIKSIRKYKSKVYH